MVQRTSKKRSSRKILDAYQIAQRAENGQNSDDSANDASDDDLVVRDGVMDASRLVGKKKKTKGRKGKDSDDEMEDEEIDSDEALGSDDDYDVLNSKFSQTIRDKSKKLKDRARAKRNGKKQIESSSSEEEDDGYASIDESQLVGLSEAWDMDDKDLAKVNKDSKKNNADGEIVLNDDWESESNNEDSGSDSEDDSESEEEEEDEDEDEEEDIFGNGSDEDVDLKSTLSNIQSKLTKPSKERKRLLTETQNENEFSLPTKGAKLSLNDMIAGVDSSVNSNAILIDKGEKVKSLATPLPKRIQERHDRKVAYDITKEEVGKWEDIVQQNRQAEVLSFPMNPSVKHNDSALTFKSDNVPTNELEKKVHNLLTDSALLDDKKEATFEEIATAKLSVDDLKKRNNELRLMRELMFREEKRAKRIKKIKSKQYHKIQKKERLRNQELVEGSDMESDGEEHDAKRAQERMTLKHKTQSQWAKSMIKSGLSKDASNRGELEEMLRQGERLRTKQLGHEEGEQSDNGVSDIEADYDNEEEDESGSRSKLGKGVLNMDFMKEAERRSKAENLKELEFLRQVEENDGRELLEDGNNNSVNLTRNQGRRVYTPSVSSMKNEMDEVDRRAVQEIEIDESKSLGKRLTKDPKIGKSLKKAEESDEVAEADADEDFNPWLSTDSNTKQKKSNKITLVDQSSTKLSKASQKISKHSKKRTGSAVDSEDAEIDLNKTLKIVDAFGSDQEEEEGANNSTFKQKDLIKEAFAGDDVIQEFDDEKRRVIVDEDDKEEDLTLPGWGDWAVAGKKNKKKKVVRKIDGVVQKDNRKDKNLKNVIINERVNKKNLKYQSSAVPFPFESREQYERALRMPVGQEWTSRETHQKLTMPRVITKQGTVIDPLKAPFK
ncbi:U3 small nucleolar RNA-associated protein 14 [[Candida] railenensis]|uniref:U3 small nucleolar RNA-associated protein 14 n=1 Tax=[Candida] railenensis TaxID=45579 RepID=A0A9P0QK86_9ASCO|nr:U3 small nucleolar RNA-associated protein 14 [[Candida] railenensis]